MAKQKGPVKVIFKLRDPPPQNITNFYASVEITFLPGSIVQLKITSSPENLLKIKNVEISQVAGIVVSQFTYKDTITIQFLNYDFKDKKIFHLNIELFNNTFYPTIKAIVYNPKQTRAPRFFFSYLYPLILEPESASSYATSETGVLRLPPESIDNMESAATISSGVLRLPLFAIQAPTETTASVATITDGSLKVSLIVNTMKTEGINTSATITNGSLKVSLITNTMETEGINTTVTITGGSLE